MSRTFVAPGRPSRRATAARALIAVTASLGFAGCESYADRYGDPGHAGARFNSFRFDDREERAQHDDNDAWVPPDDSRHGR